MPKLNRQTNEYQSEQKENNVNRRFFLQKTLISGVVLATTPTTFARNVYDNTEVCSKFSFIDSLSFVRNRISELKSNFLFGRLRDLEKQLKICRGKFFDLQKLIEDLEDEICKSQKSKQSQSVSEIIQLSQTNTKLIQTSFVEQNVKPYIIAIDTINQQIVKKAEECLPQGEITLSSKATELLRKIIKFINDDANNIYKDIEDAQLDHSIDASKIEEMFRNIDESIKKANNLLIDAENPYSGASKSLEAFKEAYKEIGNAILFLRELLKLPKIKSNISSESFSNLPTYGIPEDSFDKVFDVMDKAELIDVITLSLEGIRRGIAKQNNFLSSVEGNHNPNFKKTSFNSSSLKSAEDETISTLLWKYCRPATPIRVGEIAAIAQICSGFTGWLLGDKYQENCFKDNLGNFECEQTDGAGYIPNKDKLVKELAKYF